MYATVIGVAYTMTTKREVHWSEQTKAQNTEKGMYVGLKQPRGDGEHYVTPARAATKETIYRVVENVVDSSRFDRSDTNRFSCCRFVMPEVDLRDTTPCESS